jgi:hypothetical protein
MLNHKEEIEHRDTAYYAMQLGAYLGAIQRDIRLLGATAAHHRLLYQITGEIRSDCRRLAKYADLLYKHAKDLYE